MRNFFTTFFFTACTSLFLGVHICEAASYYVNSQTGSDSNNGTSTNTPWRNLSKVNNTSFAPGDRIHFARGSTWTGNLLLRSSGTSSNPITVTAYGSGVAPTIRNPGPTYIDGITLEGDWIVVDGFKIEDLHYAGVQIKAGSEHNIVRNTEVTRTGLGFLVRGQHNLITQNYAHDLKMVTNTPGGDDDYGANGYWLDAPNNEVSYNRCIRCKAPSYDYDIDGGFLANYATMDNAYIHHNYAEDSDGFIEFGSGRKTDTARNVRIAYNVSYNNDKAFFLAHLSDQNRFGMILDNVRVENNTVIFTLPTGYNMFQIDGTLTPSMLKVHNNIFYSTLPMTNNSSFTHSHNIFYRIGGGNLGLTLASTDKAVDPQFVSLANRDFHLKSTSPAINAGMQLGYTTDYDNASVPVGSAVDIGAFEFRLTGSSPIPSVSPQSSPRSSPRSSPQPSPDPYDINNDGVLSSADLKSLIRLFGSIPSVGDLIKDGKINLFDYTSLKQRVN